MPRVLFVAYYFPPSVDAGARRAMGFFENLPRHGWEPTLLTVQDGNYAVADSAPAFEDLPNVVRVPERRPAWHRSPRAGAPESGGASGGSASPSRFRRSVRATLYVPDAWSGFHAPALERALQMHEERPFDVVLTTSTPFTSLRTGAALRRRTGIPWVADLRDLWLDNQYGYPYGPVRRRLDEALERQWLSVADQVTTATEGQAELLRRREYGPPVTAVRAGFVRSAADPVPRTSDEYRIVFTGKIYEDPNHSADPLLDALVHVRESVGERFQRVRADFYGRVDSSFAQAVAARALDDVVRHCGLVTPDRAAEEQRDADLLVAIMPSAHREIASAKVPEYLGALAPVLLLGPPDGEAARLIAEANAGRAFEPGDTGAAAEWIVAQLDAPRADPATLAARAAARAPFSYASRAGELAAVLDGARS